jgi:hypothetical protein
MDENNTNNDTSSAASDDLLSMLLAPALSSNNNQRRRSLPLFKEDKVVLIKPPISYAKIPRPNSIKLLDSDDFNPLDANISNNANNIDNNIYDNNNKDNNLGDNDLINDNRSEIFIIQNLVSSLNKNEIIKILIKNNWNVEKSIEDCLNLSNLSSETKDSTSNSFQSKGTGSYCVGTTRSNQKLSSSQIYLESKSNQSTSLSTYRGKPTLLPINFLMIPKFRLIITKETNECLEFSLFLHITNTRLGIELNEANGKILVQCIIDKYNEETSLCFDAGVLVNDILVGIESEFKTIKDISNGTKIKEILDILQVNQSYVVLNFKRIINDKKKCDDDELLLKYDKFVTLLLDENIIKKDQVSDKIRKKIFNLSERVLNWNNECVENEITSNNNNNIIQNPNNNNIDNIRLGISIRIIKTETKDDYVIYLIWVLDIKTGTEFFIKRRFKEFYEFRELLIKIRPSISIIEFPSKRLITVKRRDIIKQRYSMLQKFLRKINSLIIVNSSHETSIPIQMALQEFLSVKNKYIYCF